MADEIVVDSLLSKLEYEANSKVIDDASKAIVELDKENKKAAKSTDLLSKETKSLAVQLDRLTTASTQLKDEQIALKRQIGDSKPTKEQKKRLRELSQELQEVGQEAKKVRADLKQLSGAEKSSAKSAKQAASAKKQLTRAVKKAQRGMKDAAKETKTLDDRLVDLAKGGLLVAGAAKALSLFTDLASKVFETSAKFQSLQASLVTVTGSTRAADAAFAGIREFASSTPFQVGQIAESFIKLTALGLDPSERALKSYGNTASAMGKDLNQIVEAVADATVGEFERLKEFGIKASSQGDKVAFTFRGNTKTIGKNAEEIQNFLLGIGETDFAGAMEMQMGTLGGKLSNLEDKVEGFFVKIGESGAVAAFGDTLGHLGDQLTDELAVSLAEVTEEGIGIFDQALKELDPEIVGGLVQLLVVVLKALAIALTPVITLFGAAANVLAMLGASIDAVIADFNSLVDTFDKVQSGALSLVDAFEARADKFSHAMDGVSLSLEGVSFEFGEVAAAAQTAEGALTSFVGNAIAKKAEALAAKVKKFGQEQIKAATDMTLRQLAESPSPAIAAAAKTEIAGREETKKVEATQKLKAVVGGEKFAPKSFTAAQKAIDSNAADFGDDVFNRLVSSGVKPDAAREEATIAAGQNKTAALARFNASGQFEKATKKKKGKGKKKQSDEEKFIFGQIDKLAKQAGQRALSRGIERAQTGEITSAEAIGGAKAERKRVRKQLVDNFTRTGALPPGLQADVRQLQRLPSVEEAVGQVAPPTIVVNNFQVDARVENLNVGEGGSFSGSAREIARETNKMIDERLSMHVREAIASVAPKEVR